MSDPDRDTKTPAIEKVLEGWRGTPLLFAHTVRTMQAATKDSDAALPILLIDVQVKGDHERFSSVEDFFLQVTDEALRYFSSIHVESFGKLGTARLTLRWLRPWWKPGPGWESDAVVELQLEGDRDWADNARPVIIAAVRRGWNKLDWKGADAALVGLGLASTLSLSIFILAYLFEWPNREFLAFIAFSIGGIAGAFVGEWVIPTLEIAPKGQSRLWRSGKAVGSIILSLFIAGLSKKLFG